MPYEPGIGKPPDLRARTKTYGIRIIRLFRALPSARETRIVGDQLLRSGTSIGAHYREAGRARSNAEFVSKIGVGLQELDETMYWLELLVESKVMPEKRLVDLMDETNQLLAIFVTLAKRGGEGNRPRAS
jgi:four helix bundle protein